MLKPSYGCPFQGQQRVCSMLAVTSAMSCSEWVWMMRILHSRCGLTGGKERQLILDLDRKNKSLWRWNKEYLGPRQMGRSRGGHNWALPFSVLALPIHSFYANVSYQFLVETELSFHWRLWDPAIKAQILFLGGEICFIKVSNWRS